MDCVNITVEEFRYAKTTEICFPGIVNLSQLHLLQFFHSKAQNKIYVVHGTQQELHEAFGGGYEFFERFGIYAQADDAPSQLISFEKEYIWFVRKEVSKEIYDRELLLLGINHFSVCAILTEPPVDDEIVRVKVSKIKENFPGLRIWNRIKDGDKFQSSRLEPFKTKNVLGLLRECRVQSVEGDVNARAVGRMFKELMRYKGKDILLVAEGANKGERMFWTCIAVPLSLMGCRVDVSPDSVSTFLALHRKALSKDYMFAEEYLLKLSNPVNVAVSIHDQMGFICIRNAKKCPKNNPVSLQIYSAPFSFQKKKISEKQIIGHLYEASDIVVMPVHDLFALDSEFGEAMRESWLLDDVLAEFEEILRVEIGIEITLNFTNILFYEYSGQEYIGYVSRMESEFDYQFLPLSKKYESFGCRVSREEYDTFLDISVFSDYEKILAKIKNYVGEDRHHFITPKGLGGMPLLALKASKFEYTEECGFSFEELGIWSTQTSQCRLGSQRLLLKYFKSDILRSKKFLTFWGGNHPAVTNHLIVDYSIWK